MKCKNQLASIIFLAIVEHQPFYKRTNSLIWALN